MTTHYFNITYRCNNQCYFCASNSAHSVFGRDMELREVHEHLSSCSVGSEDMCIINGGEPTVHPVLLQVIRSMKQVQAYVVLFTNGRLLADPGYACGVLGEGVDRVTIPLYGPDAESHDSCTGVAGSWRDTIRGIENVVGHKQPNVDLELKTLVTDRTIAWLAKTVNLVSERFPSTERFVLSGLIESDSAIRNRAGVDLRDPLFRRRLNEGMTSALSLASYLILDSIPLCVLDTGTRMEWLLRRGTQSRRDHMPISSDRFVYVDSTSPDGHGGSNWWNESHCPHTDCRLHRICRMNPQFFRGPVAASQVTPLR